MTTFEIGNDSMVTEPLDMAPLWLLDLVIGLALAVAIELGYRFGRMRHAKTPEEREQPVGAIVGSILGLLALVLSFTFSFAATKFEGRRQAVVAEANAVGTAYLRTSFIPIEQRGPTVKLLQEYVDVRLQSVRDRALDPAIKRSGEIHEELWRLAANAGETTKQPVLTGLYIQALNELIDLHEDRMQATGRSRIPLALWLGLVGLAIVGVAAVGYQSGLSKSRRSPAMAALVIAFTLVFALIADLDRAQEGLLRVTQQAIVDTQQMMQSMEK